MFIYVCYSETPGSMEELLERQWEQGSHFLMEQGQHFDSMYLPAYVFCCYFYLAKKNNKLDEFKICAGYF